MALRRAIGDVMVILQPSACACAPPEHGHEGDNCNGVIRTPGLTTYRRLEQAPVVAEALLETAGANPRVWSRIAE